MWSFLIAHTQLYLYISKNIPEISTKPLKINRNPESSHQSLGKARERGGG